MYLGFCFYSGIVRPINQEMTAIAKIICYSQFPRRGDMPCHTGPHGEAARVTQEAEGARGRRGQESLLWFQQEAMGEAG